MAKSFNDTLTNELQKFKITEKELGIPDDMILKIIINMIAVKNATIYADINKANYYEGEIEKEIDKLTEKGNENPEKIILEFLKHNIQQTESLIKSDMDNLTDDMYDALIDEKGNTKDMKLGFQLYGLYIDNKKVQYITKRNKKENVKKKYIKLTKKATADHIKLLFCILKDKGWIEDFQDSTLSEIFLKNNGTNYGKSTFQNIPKSLSEKLLEKDNIRYDTIKQYIEQFPTTEDFEKIIESIKEIL